MEILAPAGNLEKLKYALLYGADAVYTATNRFGLRAKAGNLSLEELKEATEFCHSLNKKIYVTVNIFAHNRHLVDLPEYVEDLEKIGIDAVIVSDPGVFQVVKEHSNLAIHISTQANVVSWKSAEFWHSLGAERVILARELTFDEIVEMADKVPQVELEMFVHGAMCIAYSGRCLLSAFFNNRSANLGECTQPCRWKYFLMEETRPNEFFPITEDEFGTYIMNSKDLNLINRLTDIYKAGVASIKIEGRMKSLHYVSNVTRVYRNVLNRIQEGKDIPESFIEELNNVSHRVYTEAFYAGFNDQDTQFYENSAYIRDYKYIGKVLHKTDNLVKIQILNKFEVGDEIEIIFPDIDNDIVFTVNTLYSEDMQKITFTKPNTNAFIELQGNIPEYGLVRKRI
ncbi:U32 family peptidase [bacterium]|nr:U32 family peptidase [bacterium]